MKVRFQIRSQAQQAFMLLIVVILLAISLVSLSGIYMYSGNNARLNQRANDYYSAVAAAEAATEKALGQITTDFRTDGDRYLMARLDVYRQAIPNESGVWTNFHFMDLSG